MNLSGGPVCSLAPLTEERQILHQTRDKWDLKLIYNFDILNQVVEVLRKKSLQEICRCITDADSQSGVRTQNRHCHCPTIKHLGAT